VRRGDDLASIAGIETGARPGGVVTRRERVTMAKTPVANSIAAELTVPERLLLFCLASDTDWQAASVTHATAQHMLVRGLIERGSRRGAPPDAVPACPLCEEHHPRLWKSGAAACDPNRTWRWLCRRNGTLWNVWPGLTDRALICPWASQLARWANQRYRSPLFCRAIVEFASSGHAIPVCLGLAAATGS
jgi:hypothetical protein